MRKVCIVLIAIVMLGCNGTYRAATVGTQTVNVAIGAWSDYVDTGKASIEQREAVLHAVKVYRQSLITAHVAIQAWYVEQGNGAKWPHAELKALQASSVELIKLIGLIQNGGK